MQKKKTPAKRGRPEGSGGKFTPARVKKIIELVEMGMAPTAAGQACGVVSGTMSSWRRKKPDFRAQIEKAERKAEAYFLSKVRAAMDDSWQAAAWALERRFPDRWARIEKRLLGGLDGGPITIQQMMSMSDEEAEQELKRLEEMGVDE